MTLGLVLIFIGPMLSQKVPPPAGGSHLLKNNGSVRQVRANPAKGDAPDVGNDRSKDADVQMPGQSFTGDLHINDTDANSTLEALASPEALTGGYLAYIPFQEEEEEEEDEDPEEYFDYTTRQWRIRSDKRKPEIVPLMVLPLDAEELGGAVRIDANNEPLQSDEFENDPLSSDPVRRVTIPPLPSHQQRRFPAFKREESRSITSRFRKRPPALLHPPPKERLLDVPESKRLNPFSRFRFPDPARRLASRKHSGQYPNNPMSIRDIIDYMTAVGEEEQRNRQSNLRPSPSSGQRFRNSNSHRQQPGYSWDQVEKKRSQLRRKTEPYSFLLDVYPYRNGGEIRTPEEYNANRYPVTESPSQHVALRPETTTQTFWDLHSGEPNGYRVQYQDSDRPRYPSIGTVPPGVLPLETTTHFDSVRSATESSSRQQEKQVVIHLNVYNEKPTGAPTSRC